MKTMFIYLLIGFGITLLIMPLNIIVIKKLKGEQTILSYVDAHTHKKGTATMGGIGFILGTTLSFLPLINGYNRLSAVVLGSMLGFGLVGFLDDFIKIRLKQNLGLKPYQKIIGQFGIAIIVAFFIYYSPLIGGQLFIPFTFKTFDLSYGIIPFSIFVFIATTNAVNLTDGLDNLAAGVTKAYLVGFVGILIVYLQHLQNSGASAMLINEYTNLICLTFAFMGSLIAFEIFNSHPAKIFMGDTGSLAIGAYLASLAMVTKQQLLIPILGLMFVLSTISVILQVLYYKKTKKRIFLMAPLHHHFEKKGCYETKVVTIYIIITLMISISALTIYL